MNSCFLFAGITTSKDGSFLIVLNVFQSIKFVDDWMLNLFVDSVKKPTLIELFLLDDILRLIELFETIASLKSIL